MSTDQPDAPRPRRRINFEISVRRQRRWEVFGTYSAAERDLALAEAKKLEKDGSDGAKVTKETYNLDTDQVETAVIYRSPALEKEMIELAASRPRPAVPPPPPGKPTQALSRRSKPAAAGTSKSAPANSGPAKPRSDSDDTLFRALPWILAALVGACLIGGAVTVGASYSLQYAVATGIAMTDQTQIGILVGVFVIVTGTLLFGQLRRIMRRFGLARSVNRGAPRDPATPPPVGDQPPDNVAEPAPVAAAPAAPVPSAPPLALQQAQSFEAAMAGGIAGGLGSLDTGQRFAANVYIGGAIDHLAGSHDLDRHACRDLFTSALLRLGAPAEMASRLPELLEGYLGQPKVHAMYEAGAAHMAAHLAGHPFDIAACMADWEAVKAARPGAGDQVVAILVTEIVEPDAAAGKSAARRARAHERLVRRAIESCDGVEIKRDGGGIVASFATPSGAVDTATRIVDGVADHAAEHPDLPLNVRIGIDAGPVVHDGGDLVGATVQLASRLCDSCAEGEILVSRALRDLCGDGYQFRQLEDMSLRDFPEPESVCRVIPASDNADRSPTVARAG